MNELLQFATHLIELEGGAVVQGDAVIEALVPQRLEDAWEVPEELHLAAEAQAPPAMQLAYGTELLERMIQTAVAGFPVASTQLELPPVRTAQVRRALTHFQLRNGVVDPGEVRCGRQTRLWLDARAILHGDERRELLVHAVVSPQTGAPVPGFADSGLELCPQSPAMIPAVSEQALAAALRACQAHTLRQAAGFRASMERRYERDRSRIRSYFDDLEHELDQRAARGRLATEAIDEKRAALRADCAAKLEALTARFVLRIELQPIALRIFELDGTFVQVTLRRRKVRRSIALEYDGATRRLVPVPCEACGGPTQAPAACDTAVHLLCEQCVPRPDGRVSCPVCRRPGQVEGASHFR